MAEIKNFTGGEKFILSESFSCETIINSELILDPSERAKFSKLYYTLCTSQIIGEGGFFVGDITGKDSDENELAARIVFHPKINDQVLTFLDDKANYKIALRESEPKLHVIPLDESKPFAEDLGESGLRLWMRKAMDVYYSTLQ
jgi:hypothetical protein